MQIEASSHENLEIGLERHDDAVKERRHVLRRHPLRREVDLGISSGLGCIGDVLKKNGQAEFHLLFMDRLYQLPISRNFNPIDIKLTKRRRESEDGVRLRCSAKGFLMRWSQS